jgi:hypothetical protein
MAQPVTVWIADGTTEVAAEKLFSEADTTLSG